MAGASGIFAALLVGTVVSIVFALRAAENARVADENARVANERERDATYQSYRARIAAAVAALSHHDVADAARQLDAAPEALRDWEWRHLRTRLDDSTSVFPAAAGESQFLIRDPKGIRIATLTPASLRLTDLEGNELLTRSFRPENHLMHRPPLPTRHGLRLVGGDGESMARNPALAQSPDSTTNILNLLDDEGRVQTRLKGPVGNGSLPGGRQPGRFAAGSDLDWAPRNGSSRCTTRIRANRRATSAQDIGYTWALAFSPDGTRIATAGEDGLTRLWDTSTGTMTAQCRGHTRKVLSVAFRPDGRRLVTTSADGTVRQWDSATGREVESPYERHIGEVVTAAYSPDGLWVASGGTDRTVRVWEAASRHDVAVLHGHTGVVSELAFTADGRRLASASQSGRARRHGGWHGADLGGRPAGGHVRAARPHQLHLSGGVQPGRPMDRLGELGQDRALVGRGDRGELRDPAPAGVCARAGLQPGQLVVGLRMRSGRIVAHLERRDRPAREQVQGARNGLIFRRSR